MAADFVHLHLHSQYSLLDGANRLGDVIASAGEMGMPAVALTDHGNLFGAIEFYNLAKKNGVNPLVGIEAYTAQGSMHERIKGQGSSNHLVLLAKNETGYRNLLYLSSRAYLEGFYYKPRIDVEMLREHSEGLVCLSACLKGVVAESITAGEEKQAERLACEYREIFGDGNYFLEMQDHGIPEQRQANEVIRRISQRTGIPMVVTNDCHYLKKDDAFAHDVLLCIGTQKNVADPDRLKYASDQFFMKSGAEMARLFPDDGEAIENTLRVAAMCDLEIDQSTFHLPEFPVPEGESLASFFRKLTRDRLGVRLKELAAAGSPSLARRGEEAYWQRLDREMEIIVEMGFPGYFLIVWDFIDYARQRGIPVGPGRGSAAGSLVSYALGITDIDPLRYELLFERFLNPERVSMPDIDIDFCMRRRSEVISYVSEKYGRDHVAQIITFGTLAAKAVIRDVGRVMGTAYAKVDRVAKLVPDMTRSLAEAEKEVDALKSEAARDPEVGQILEVGKRLNGLTRHASVHAAGVVITPRPLEEVVPLYKSSKDEVMTQWDKDVIEDLGLLKMDFLGLRTLTVIDDAVTILNQSGVDLDLDLVPLDDPAVFELFCDGRTDGVFQFESRGMKDLLRRAEPSKFEDLAAFNALYRPGALSVGMVEEYIQRKLGKKRVSYTLPQTEEILEETYGVIVYQEQVMQIAVEVAGFTMGEADILRKAMGKKKLDVMEQQKEKFVSGAAERGVARAKARQLWDYIEPFAGYGFNKSHSVAYAMLAYKTAYLKAHYPVAFMAAMLNSELGSSDAIAKYVRECREMGIEVLPPSINTSEWFFTVDGDTIRFGLGAVKGVGESAIEGVLEARRKVGEFTGLTHFACEVTAAKGVNHKVFEVLIKAGCFDVLGDPRRALMEALDPILDFAQRKRREIEAGQTSLFGDMPELEPSPDPGVGEWPEQVKLSYEKEALGFYVTGNPLNQYQADLEAFTTHTTEMLKEAEEGTVTIGGLVTRMRQTKIKTGPNAGRFMGRFVLEDLHGRIPVMLFANQFQQYGSLLEDGAIVLVKGLLRPRGSEIELSADEVSLLTTLTTRPPVGIEVTLDAGTSDRTMLEIKNLALEHHGELPLIFRVRLDGDSCRRIHAADSYKVAGDDRLDLLVASLERVVGSGRVQVLQPEAV